MYRGPKEHHGNVFRAHQCPRCSIIYLTVERIVEENEAEMLEASLYMLKTSSTSKPWTTPSEQAKHKSSGIETQES